MMANNPYLVPQKKARISRMLIKPGSERSVDLFRPCPSLTRNVQFFRLQKTVPLSTGDVNMGPSTQPQI